MQAKLLAPGHVELVHFEDVQKEPLDPGCCALLFPSEEALKPEELDLSKIKNVFVVDRCGSYSLHSNSLCNPARIEGETV